jgi:hypothetical protein
LWDLQSPVGLSEMVLCENDSVRVPLWGQDWIIYNYT